VFGNRTNGVKKGTNVYRGHDLSDLQRFNLEQEERYYYERDRLAHLDSQAFTDFSDETTKGTNMNLPLTSKVIATGSSSTEDSALEYLKLYGCEVEYCSSVTLIRLPENAKLEKGNLWWDYSISFASQFDDDETYVSVELSCDVQETIVKLSMDDKYKGIRDYVASFFDFKYKEGVIIKYIKLEYIEGPNHTPEHLEGDYWKARFNIISATEDRTIANVALDFDFVGNKYSDFVAISQPTILELEEPLEEPNF
jgi:hypothetical protein